MRCVRTWMAVAVRKRNEREMKKEERKKTYLQSGCADTDALRANMDNGSCRGGADEYKERMKKKTLLDVGGRMHCVQTRWRANANVLDAAGG